MTDELELLLEEEEAREEGELPALFPVRSRAGRDRPTGETPMSFPPAETPMAPAPAEKGRVTALRAAERTGERGERRGNRPPPAETESSIRAEEAQSSLSAEKAESPRSFETEEGALRLPGRFREDAAGRFYRALLRTGRAANYRRTEERESVRPGREQAAESPAPDAAGLDRLLRRDARRYDGGFTWQ